MTSDSTKVYLNSIETITTYTVHIKIFKYRNKDIQRAVLLFLFFIAVIIKLSKNDFLS